MATPNATATATALTGQRSRHEPHQPTIDADDRGLLVDRAPRARVPGDVIPTARVRAQPRSARNAVPPAREVAP